MTTGNLKKTVASGASSAGEAQPYEGTVSIAVPKSRRAVGVSRIPTDAAAHYLARFRKVLDYIDRHLDQDLAVERLSAVAGFSKYHFHRQFTALFGIGVYRYVQLQRLKRAAYRLAFRADGKIIDIAFDSGYEGHEAFSRAFKKILGQSPSGFRKQPHWIAWHANYRPISDLRIKHMRTEYRAEQVEIIDFKPTRVAALRHRGDPQLVGATVRRFIEWRRQNKLAPTNSATFNIFHDDPAHTDAADFRLDLCAATEREIGENPFGVTAATIPGGRCAVFRHTGAEHELAAIGAYLYRQWLPQSGEQLGDFPMFCQRVSFFPDVPAHAAVTDLFLPLRAPQPAAYFVGLRTTRIADPADASGFPALLMYPSAVPSAPLALGPYTLDASRDAPLAPGRFPLLVISHGGGGSHLVYRDIAAYLARRGYIVAMPEHGGNNRDNNALEGTLANLVKRPRDISLTVDALCADPHLRDGVLADRVALIGHSMGGYTALAVAGGLPRYETGQEVAVRADGRVKALVLMAPATGWYLPGGRLDRVTAPILLLLAEHDPWAPAWNGELVQSSVPDPSRVSCKMIANAGHFSFLSPFPEAMASPQFAPSTDPAGFDRAAFQRRLHPELLAFLDRHLKASGPLE